MSTTASPGLLPVAERLKHVCHPSAAKRKMQLSTGPSQQSSMQSENTPDSILYLKCVYAFYSCSVPLPTVFRVKVRVSV